MSAEANLSLPDLLKVAGSRTATLRETDILIPPIVVESSFLGGADEILIEFQTNGTVVISPAVDGGTKLYGNRVVNPDELLATVGWTPGDTVQFDVQDDTVVISKIDREADASFSSPSIESSGLAIPPAWMIQAFTGQPDVRGYLNSGPRSIKTILETVSRWGLEASDIHRVLDFGSGCGRILRHWSEHSHIKATGCDLHEVAIGWCQQHYEFADFYNGTEFPPSPLEDNSVDLIYAISVLTHLDEQHQNQWLAEWKRIVKPGGIVIATFRGEDFVESVIAAKARRERVLADLDSVGITFAERPGWTGVFESFYGGTYHSRDYVTREWSKHFEVLELIDSGKFINRQNAAIMRKK